MNAPAGRQGLCFACKMGQFVATLSVVYFSVHSFEGSLDLVPFSYKKGSHVLLVWLAFPYGKC